MSVVETVTEVPESAIRTIHTDLPVNATFHVWLKAKRPPNPAPSPSPTRTENSLKFQASIRKSSVFESIRCSAVVMWN